MMEKELTYSRREAPPLRPGYAEGLTPTRAEIDLRALEFNFRQVRKRVGKGTKIMVVVKADAYGHGMLTVAARLQESGADYFGVARIEEALQLRAARIRTPIIILNAILPEQAEPVVEHGFTQTVGDKRLASALNRAAEKQGKTAPIHLKVDTGMGRIGVWHERAVNLTKEIIRLRHVKLNGISTHFPSADCDPEFTSWQIRRFRSLITELEKEGIRIPERHAANSAGILGFRNACFTLVRPGLMVYGLRSSPAGGRSVRLRPVLSLKTRITFLKKVGPRRTISYQRTYVTDKETVIATIPVGYADGYFRSLSNRARVLVRGRRAPVVGRICMDQTMADVGGIRGVKLGDEVVLLGAQKSERISCEELAELAGTIPYEIVSAISGRIPRIYLR